MISTANISGYPTNISVAPLTYNVSIGVPEPLVDHYVKVKVPVGSKEVWVQIEPIKKNYRSLNDDWEF